MPPADPNDMVARLAAATGNPLRRKEKRVRDAYICFWANRNAFDKLNSMAKERGVTRSEMARTIFGAGIAALGGIGR